MTNSIKDAIFYHIYPLGFCGVINNKEKSTKNLGLNKIDKNPYTAFVYLPSADIKDLELIIP